MKKLNFLDVIVFLFMFLFIYAAVSKLVEYDLFRAQLGKSPLLTRYAGIFSWLVPGVELIVAGMLFIPRYQLTGLYGAFTLMLGFTGYIAFILTFSPYVPCSCGGILSSMGWGEHLIFNIAFTVLAFVGIVLFGRRFGESTTLYKKPI
ncbi:MAG TPA: MauE/DoxX family redox-associated membrane protein [Chryseosolibacter sp.]|nr:MauE/DoxX family redox-associated membrane protein [Chryseosolibacter sp.]